jgi:arginine:agmatine antiporter
MIATTEEVVAHAPGDASMGVWGATALVAGSMIGSGVYLLPATFGLMGSISVLGWIAATLAALAIGGLFARLCVAAPDARGIGGYVKAGLGPFGGVVANFMYMSCSWVGNVALALAVAGYAAYLLPVLAPSGPRLATTLVVIWAAVFLSWLGPRSVARAEAWTLAIGLAPVLLAGTFGWLVFSPKIFLASWNPQHLDPLTAARAAGLIAFWGFLGVEGAAAVAGVVRDPVRNVPRATFGGTLAVGLAYVAVSVAMMGLLPAATLARSTAPFAEAAGVLLGVGAAAAIALCALLRAFGCLSGWTLILVESGRSGADEGAFLRFFRTRPGERASLPNLALSGALTSLVAVLTASGTLGQQFGHLANVAVLLSLYAYILAGLSLVRLEPRPGTIALALAAIAASATLAVSGDKLDLLWSLVPMAAGALLYLPLRRQST